MVLLLDPIGKLRMADDAAKGFGNHPPLKFSNWVLWNPHFQARWEAAWSEMSSEELAGQGSVGTLDLDT